MQKKEHAGGLTLVEAMIIIVVIGLLVSIVLPLLVKARYHSNFASCIFNLNSYGKSLDLYRSDHGSFYPGKLEELVEKRYLPGLKKCPSNSSEYLYEANADRSKFTIVCQGWHYRVLDNIPKGYPQYYLPNGLVESPPEKK
ncbi:MAG: type II secretion system GspH family protein [Chloroflexi bacterium]|nr:type II secretion system GspH family protein [Chloroflexota bacterium]